MVMTPRILAGAARWRTASVGLGAEFHLGDDDLGGGALTWEGAFVHMAAFDFLGRMTVSDK